MKILSFILTLSLIVPQTVFASKIGEPIPTTSKIVKTQEQQEEALRKAGCLNADGSVNSNAFYTTDTEIKQGTERTASCGAAAFNLKQSADQAKADLEAIKPSEKANTNCPDGNCGFKNAALANADSGPSCSKEVIEKNKKTVCKASDMVKKGQESNLFLGLFDKDSFKSGWDCLGNIVSSFFKKPKDLVVGIGSYISSFFTKSDSKKSDLMEPLSVTAESAAMKNYLAAKGVDPKKAATKPAEVNKSLMTKILEGAQSIVNFILPLPEFKEAWGEFTNTYYCYSCENRGQGLCKAIGLLGYSAFTISLTNYLAGKAFGWALKGIGKKAVALAKKDNRIINYSKKAIESVASRSARYADKFKDKGFISALGNLGKGTAKALDKVDDIINAPAKLAIRFFGGAKSSAKNMTAGMIAGNQVGKILDNDKTLARELKDALPTEQTLENAMSMRPKTGEGQQLIMDAVETKEAAMMKNLQDQGHTVKPVKNADGSSYLEVKDKNGCSINVTVGAR